METESDQIQTLFRSEDGLDQLQKLKNCAEKHISFSELYLPILRSMSQTYDTEKNISPWKTLKEGSYYLQNAHDLVQVYKDGACGSIDNTLIKSVNDMLVALEFDPKHITSKLTDEADGGTDESFVSKGQGTKYYKLLHSDFKKDVRSFIEFVELNIDIPVKRFLESVNDIVQPAFCEKLLKAIENANFSDVENYIKKGVDVNCQDTDGRTPLHLAVNNGNIDVVRTLLKNGAKVFQITKKGNTPLHTASLKDSREVIEVLLQNVSPKELEDLINAKTTSGGTTALHVASKNGFLGVVKSLLRHGAIYKIENKEGKTPVDLSNDYNVTQLLKLIEELFKDVQKGNVEAIQKLSGVKRDNFLALTNARNNQGNTLLQVAVANKHKNIADKFLNMIVEPDRLQCELDELEDLKGYAERHMKFSRLYLSMLRGMSLRCDSEKNTNRWKTLKEGSYFLGNAYDIVRLYKNRVPGVIDYKDIESINDILVGLGFDRKHITVGFTDEAYGGEAECFVSKGQGTKYYELLHSDSTKDVRSFIEFVELYIDIPVRRFIESASQRLHSVFSEKLFEAIKYDNSLAVENCIKKGVDVNCQDTDGRTPLYHAVNNGNVNVVIILLKKGANITQVTNKVDTLLHLASSKGYKEVVEILLQNTCRDKLNDFINTKKTPGGTTSLHVATKNGFLEVVKSLLKHGAIYNIKDEEGKTPFDVSQGHQNITNLLIRIDELFENAMQANDLIFNKLKKLQQDEFLTVTCARNYQRKTLLQVASSKHKAFWNKFLEC